MEKRRMLWTLILVILIVFLAGCSWWDGTDSLSGNSVAEVSTLEVRVVDDQNQILEDASVYVDGDLKGKTRKYGEYIGEKTVILDSTENIIHAEKEGYISSQPIKVSASLRGSQRLTLTLEKKRVQYTVIIEEDGQPVPDAIVSLSKYKGTSPVKTIATNNQGIAKFEKIDNGNYTISIEKQDYLPMAIRKSFQWSIDGDSAKSVIEVSQVPMLEVRVQDANYNPLPEAEVTLYSQEDYNTPGALPLNVKYTLEGGRIIFKDVVRDREYVVIVKKQKYQAETQEKTLTSYDQLMVFQLEEN